MQQSFVLFDTEYTSWQGCVTNGWDESKNQYKELLQIGALRVQKDTFTIIDTFQTFCRPVRNPQLSEYIMMLTGIAQSTVDKAETFQPVIRQFEQWVGDRELFSFGDDYDIFRLNAEYSNIQLNIPARQSHNLKLSMKEAGFPTDLYHSGILCTYYDKTPEGKDHNALADAQNVLITLREMHRRKEFRSVISHFVTMS